MADSVPRLVILTDRRQSEAAGRGLVDTVAAALDAGAPAVLLREKDLPDPQRHRLARTLAEVAARAGARLLIAGDPVIARDVGAAGVHLAADDTRRVQGGLLVGRSCHDEAEVRDALRRGADLLTVSPVAATPSKPGYGPPLGPGGVTALAEAAGGVPVLALGGVVPGAVGAWRAAGAHGVAVMGAVMRAADPAAVVQRLLDALGEDPPMTDAALEDC